MLLLSYVGIGFIPAMGVVLLMKHRRAGIALLGTQTASLMMTLILQYLALRPRPEVARLLWPTPNFPSFPSGHAAVAFATTIFLGLMFQQSRVWLVGGGTATLIALSRVYLGHHYPTDILAGAILGCGIGAAGYGLGLTEEPPRWKWLLWPQVALVLVITEMAYLHLVPRALLRWPGADKTLHFILFGAVVFWLNAWWGGRRVGRYLPLAIILPLVLATLEEILQQFSPVRTMDIADWLSDFSGMCLCWWLSEQLLRWPTDSPRPAPRSA